MSHLQNISAGEQMYWLTRGPSVFWAVYDQL